MARALLWALLFFLAMGALAFAAMLVVAWRFLWPSRAEHRKRLIKNEEDHPI